MAEMPEDAACIAQMARGDEAALQTICTRYRVRLWSYLWQQLDGNRGAAEEALQDTFLAVWRGAATFRGTSPVAVWLFRIAHHVAANARRHMRRHDEGHLTHVGDESVWEASATTEWEAQLVDRLTLQAALARLSPKHREVLDLICVQGFVSDEVAHILDIPAASVRSRLRYARQALAQFMQGQSAAEEVAHER
ncbi:MAG: RNA polymerase sigma factor [Ktedonobacterales bacterium]|nr:RNA polymerase sigma factor [Ktedonobacterales bacterium]